MALDLLCTAAAEPVLGHLAEQALEQVPGVLTEMAGELGFLEPDLHEYFGCDLGTEGGQAGQHLVYDGAQAPPVHGAAVAHLVQHLGGCALEGAVDALGLFVLVDALLAEAEVGQPDVPLGVEQHVFGLEVAVDDVAGVDVLEGQHHLGRVEAGLVLDQRIALPNEVGEPTSLAELEHEEEAFGTADRVEQLGDEGVAEVGQHPAPGDHAVGVLLLLQRLLLQLLYRVGPSVAVLARQKYLCERPLPDLRQHLEVLDAYPLPLLLQHHLLLLHFVHNIIDLFIT